MRDRDLRVGRSLWLSKNRRVSARRGLHTDMISHDIFQGLHYLFPAFPSERQAVGDLESNSHHSQRENGSISWKAKRVRHNVRHHAKTDYESADHHGTIGVGGVLSCAPEDAAHLLPCSVRERTVAFCGQGEQGTNLCRRIDNRIRGFRSQQPFLGGYAITSVRLPDDLVLLPQKPESMPLSHEERRISSRVDAIADATNERQDLLLNLILFVRLESLACRPLRKGRGGYGAFLLRRRTADHPRRLRVETTLPIMEAVGGKDFRVRCRAGLVVLPGRWQRWRFKSRSEFGDF